ncbi:MAG: DUF2848 family protein, partial [Halobacteriales archaeon]|nr:DUF2848 family protein [Halobacteriales archaeon]
DRCINGGYSGRDEASVQAHIDELAEDGIPAPDRVPMFYPLAPYTVLVDPGSIQVVGGATSGEAEFGILHAGEEKYVVAASDQTDRDLETQSIQLAKQIAPNVLSRRAWRYSAIEDHWDDIELRAWNTIDGERRLYQEAELGTIRRPNSLFSEMVERFGGSRHGTAMLSGTVPTVSGELRPGSRFEVELYDPELDRSLRVGYDIDEI